jgi:hypothetical protein
MTVRCASWLSALAAVGLALGLAACDGGASAVKAPKAGDVATAAEPASDRDAPSYGGGAYDSAPTRPDPRDAPVRKVAGKPMWAANRTRTAEENAQRGFERYGAEFAAADVDDYVRKTHAFVGPSAGRGADPDARQWRHPDLRPQGQCLRGGHQGRRAAHHVQARRRRDLLGHAEGRPEPADHGARRGSGRPAPTARAFPQARLGGGAEARAAPARSRLVTPVGLIRRPGPRGGAQRPWASL